MVFQAGLIAFMRTLLIFVGIYYAFKIIFRFLVPWVLKRFLNKQFSSFDQSNQTSNSNNDNASQKKSKRKDSLGEYVDYEEIKDE